MKLLLGSGSPRRKELLEHLGFAFEVVKINCEENYPPSLSPHEIAGYLSVLKAKAYTDLKDGEILLTADTIVVLGDKILGKPANHDEAMQMLMELSGKTHQVYTGVTLRTNKSIKTQTDVANVTMEDISPEEAAFYLEKYQPYDKAGSYGIQDWIGMAKISKTEGSYYTIMGLPTHLVYHMLKTSFPGF